MALLVQLPVQLFLAFWFGGFVGGVSKSILGFAGPPPFVTLGAIAFFAIPCVTILGKKLSYGQTEYRFFKDHVEVTEGFFARQMKSVAYRDVREITLRRGVLQRLCGLGSIYLGTLATGSGSQFNPFSSLGVDHVTASGVAVRDLPDPDASYAAIRRRIDASKAASVRDDGF